MYDNEFIFTRTADGLTFEQTTGPAFVPGTYAGFLGIPKNRLLNFKYVSGACIWLSKDNIDYIIKNKNNLDKTLIDDISIGKLLIHKKRTPLNTRYIINNNKQCNKKILLEEINKTNCDIIRIKNTNDNNRLLDNEYLQTFTNILYKIIAPYESYLNMQQDKISYLTIVDNNNNPFVPIENKLIQLPPNKRIVKQNKRISIVKPIKQIVNPNKRIVKPIKQIVKPTKSIVKPIKIINKGIKWIKYSNN